MVYPLSGMQKEAGVLDTLGKGVRRAVIAPEAPRWVINAAGSTRRMNPAKVKSLEHMAKIKGLLNAFKDRPISIMTTNGGISGKQAVFRVPPHIILDRRGPVSVSGPGGVISKLTDSGKRKLSKGLSYTDPETSAIFESLV